MARGGGRVDWGLTEKDHLTFQGDFYDGNTGWRLTTPTLTAPFSETRDLDANFTGGNFLSRWTRRFDEKSDLTLQFYYDLTRTELDLREIRHTIDVDFQHRFPWGGRQELVWGIEYRLTRDDIRDTFNFSFNRDSRTSHLVSGFLQDEIVLLRDRLRLVVGSKFEANDYSGFEIQPNLRLLWTPHERHAFWASVSRAVRTPTRADEDVRFNIQAFEGPGIPILLRVFGNRAINAEDLLAAETGYRVWPTDRLSLDLALFFNRYTNLRTAEPGSPFLESGPPPQHVVVPVILANKMDGIVYGAEFCADWTIFDWWRVVGVYSFLRIHLDLDDDSLSAGSLDDEKRSPEHQVSLRTMFDLPWNLELDAWFRYVDGLPALSVGHYVTLDLRLGWRPVKNLEVSVVGQNLLDNHHLEFRPTALSTQATEVERSVYGKLLWSF
jgi:iron complex outermembrane receptor protein